MFSEDSGVSAKSRKRPGFSKDKFKTAILYIASKCANIRTFGKTVLWKLLYFADFDSYELRNASITGETYRKIEHGPAPCHFDSAISEMKAKKLIKEEHVKAGNSERIKFIPLAEPDLSLFDGAEKEILDRTIAKLASMNATQISELSHRDMPWKATKMKEEIDYELVFYRDALLSVRESSK